MLHQYFHNSLQHFFSWGSCWSGALVYTITCGPMMPQVSASLLHPYRGGWLVPSSLSSLCHNPLVYRPHMWRSIYMSLDIWINATNPPESPITCPSLWLLNVSTYVCWWTMKVVFNGGIGRECSTVALGESIIEQWWGGGELVETISKKKKLVMQLSSQDNSGWWGATLDKGI